MVATLTVITKTLNKSEYLLSTTISVFYTADVLQVAEYSPRLHLMMIKQIPSDCRSAWIVPPLMLLEHNGLGYRICAFKNRYQTANNLELALDGTDLDRICLWINSLHSISLVTVTDSLYRYFVDIVNKQKKYGVLANNKFYCTD